MYLPCSQATCQFEQSEFAMHDVQNYVQRVRHQQYVSSVTPATLHVIRQRRKCLNLKLPYVRMLPLRVSRQLSCLGYLAVHNSVHADSTSWKEVTNTLHEARRESGKTRHIIWLQLKCCAWPEALGSGRLSCKSIGCCIGRQAGLHGQ
jgi:hypothetical protein